MNARDELAAVIYSTDPWLTLDVNSRLTEPTPWVNLDDDDRENFYPQADSILAAGYRKPRTITDHYAEGGTDSLRGGTVILSNGEALLAQSDGTFCDPTGSTWDFWELELPITVLYEPGGAA